MSMLSNTARVCDECISNGSNSHYGSMGSNGNYGSNWSNEHGGGLVALGDAAACTGTSRLGNPHEVAGGHTRGHKAGCAGYAQCQQQGVTRLDVQDTLNANNGDLRDTADSNQHVSYGMMRGKVGMRTMGTDRSMHIAPCDLLQQPLLPPMSPLWPRCDTPFVSPTCGTPPCHSYFLQEQLREQGLLRVSNV